MIPINIVAEDILSRTVVVKLLSNSGQRFDYNVIYDNGGFGYIKKNILKFNIAAKFCPYIILTDLDMIDCPVALITEWFKATKIEPNLIFRIAEKEIESWILADRDQFSKYLGISKTKLPESPDLIADPKQFLMNLVKSSRKRDLKDRILPDAYSGASQGPDYNGALIEFVENHWDINSSALNSPSLKRAIDRISGFKAS